LNYPEDAVSTLNAPLDGLRRAWRVDKPLTLVGAAMIATLVAALVGIVVDPTVITGAPAWLKPAKFAISVAIYSFTLLWLLTFIQGRARLVRAVATSTAVMLAIEMVVIIGAAAAGTTSHFNVSTPWHTVLWSTMGTAIVIVWVANLVVGVLLLRQQLPDRAFAWSLRLGVLGSAIGMGVAFFMTAPTAAQLTGARATGKLPISGAHSVGLADGGAGLPVLGWSTVGGDLRVGHFIGLHSLQVLPILGFLLTRYAPAWLRPVDRMRLIFTAGAAYIAIVLLATWQALRGQPLIHPDALTLGTLAAILVAATATATAILRTARRSAAADAGTTVNPTTVNPTTANPAATSVLR
jgi:hypothetical protein